MAMPPATARLAFRELVHEDERDLFGLFADPQARRFYPRMAAAAEVRRWIAWNRQSYRRFGFGLWALIERSSGAFVGDCGLTFQRAEGREVLELGYHLMAARRGHGLALEAARAVKAHGFRATRAPSIASIVDPDNEPSIRLASRLHDQRRSFVDELGRQRLLFLSARPAP